MGGVIGQCALRDVARTFVVSIALLFLIVPCLAYADDANYSIDEISTELTVQTDGSVHAIERQVVTFDDMNQGYTWYLRVPGNGQSMQMNVVRAAAVDDGGTPTGEWMRLQMVDVNSEVQGEKPGDAARWTVRSKKTQPWYSYSVSDGMVRSWFPVDEEKTYLIEADYTVSNYISVYRDVAELYWRYVHASLPVDSRDVTLKVSLPVPAGESIVPGRDVLAWGHGPDEGAFEIGEDGSTVYHIDQIESGQYAEAHVVFPSSLISNLSPRASHVYSELRLQSVLTEEGGWVDSYARGAHWDYQVRVLFLGITAFVILAGIVSLVRFGRSYRSRRALIRVGCTLAIVALFASLFFRESLTVWMLLATAVVVLLLSLALPGVEFAQESEIASVDDGLGNGGCIGDGMTSNTSEDCSYEFEPGAGQDEEQFEVELGGDEQLDESEQSDVESGDVELEPEPLGERLGSEPEDAEQLETECGDGECESSSNVEPVQESAEEVELESPELASDAASLDHRLDEGGDNGECA